MKLAYVIGLALACSVYIPASAQESATSYAGIPANADWSQLSREATFDQVSSALARINEGYRQDYVQAVDAGTFLEPVFNATLDQVVALRDAVASNPYVRISSFSITASISPSITVEFTFPPANE